MGSFWSLSSSSFYPYTCMFLYCLAVLLCFCFLLPAPMHAQLVPGVYMFGDSQVDVGNNNYLALSPLKANFPHNGLDYPQGKATGRFSNGYNPADFIAMKVGLPTSPPYLSLTSNSSFLQGVSFASGGAGVFNTTHSGWCISLDKQIEYFSNVYEALVQQLGSSKANQHLSSSFFVIVIGSNDIFEYFESGSNATTPQQYVNSLVSKLRGQLKSLYDLSARKVIFIGTGAVGCTPDQRSKNATGDCNEEINDWSVKYNQGVGALLQGMKSEYGNMSYSFFDTSSAMLQYIHNPTTYGFVEVKAACCGRGNLNAEVPCIPIATYCSNRTDHVFWDFVHPTETLSRMLTDIVFDGPITYVYPINARKLANL